MKHDCIDCPYKSQASKTLDENGMAKLTDNHVAVGFCKGDNIIKQGNYTTNVAFLRKGFVKIHITGPAGEHITRLAKAPTHLGLPTTFGVNINQYSVTAISDVEVCFIDFNTFLSFLHENTAFSYQIILELCNNELESYRRCVNRTQKQTRGNVADILIEFSDEIYNSDTFTMPLNQTEIGTMCDSTRESISRILSEYEKDGIITIQGKTVTILKKKSLEMISKNG
jgi:CRP/FNR family transcriptional regulator